MQSLVNDLKFRLSVVRQLLPSCLRRDRARLESRLQRLADHPPADPVQVASILDRLQAEAQASTQKRQERLARLPKVSYPPELPITAKKDDIIEAIRNHPVVIIAGETGSGKTTQIPKMCLDAGLGLDGKIACTQPRRVAALSISQRIAEELGVTWGKEIGCKIRFADQSGPESYIKMMTDGILLAETQGDPELSEYEVIIIDEAHERSLNIDFLLGYLQLLRKKRPELKIVITSATIDTQAFSAAFDNAPIIEVSGRLFPVEVHYAPLDAASEESGDQTYIDAAVNVVETILIESHQGDILIFMPGERDIRETRDLLAGRGLGAVEVIPLFGRLSAGDQQKVFAPCHRRKIIIATNIAETSLTIPGIRYVIDSGLARISRYSPRTRTKRLPVEPISQSSANQRKGRSGRVQNGVCIRLYSEEDYNSRPPYTQPEIQRANLAEVILRMKAFRLGEIEQFPFLNPPLPQAIAGGYSLLHELGALDETRQLTPQGRDLARLPIDPTIGRMILQSQREHALAEVLVIAAGLSIQDPRERPMEARDAADAAHKRFQNPYSDFLTLLNIWTAYHDEMESLRTQNQVRKFCKSHFLSYQRMREWRDIHTQLEETLKELGPVHLSKQEAPYDAIHRSILSGLLGHVGQWMEKNIYRTSGNRQLMVFPGSSLFDKNTKPSPKKPAPEAKPEKSRQPEWMVAGELVETTRLYARTVAEINPEWIRDLAGHILIYTYSDPQWNARAGRVLAREKATLYGLEVANNKVAYGLINAREATEIFIRSALVEEDIDIRHRFFQHNHEVRQKIENSQTRRRTYDLPDLDEALCAFYGKHLENVSSTHDLSRVIREKIAENVNFLCATEAELTGGRDLHYDAQAFPDAVQVGLQKLPLQYAYAPGEENDGVTVKLPLQVAQNVPAEALAWMVPGLREEQLTELMRALPKAHRIALMPLAPKVKELVDLIDPVKGEIPEQLSRLVHSRYGVAVPVSAWNTEALPNYLRPRFEITGKENKVLAAGRDLEQLQQQLKNVEAPVQQTVWNRAAQTWERFGLSSWTFGDVPEQVPVGDLHGVPLFAYPGLQMEESEISLRLFQKREEALQFTRLAWVRLAELSFEREMGWLQKDLRSLDQHKTLYVTLGSGDELKETAYLNLKRHLFYNDNPLPLKEAAFNAQLAQAREQLTGLAIRFSDWVGTLLKLRQELLIHRKPYASLRSDLDALLPARFLEKIPFAQLQHIPRYLKAMLMRAERASLNSLKDQERARLIKPYQDALEKWKKVSSHTGRTLLMEYRWMLEEYKVSIYAQELGTAQTISAKRLDKQLEALQQFGG